MLGGMAAAGLMVAALLLFRGAAPSEALKPKPVQPFAPSITTGLKANALGGAAGTKYNITVTQGTRLTLPTFFSVGFPTRPDKEVTDGTPQGTVEAENDVLCNGTKDYLLQQPAPYDPFVFYEQTTNVDTDGQLGTDDDDYVRFNSPLWSMIVRQRADLDGLHLGGLPGLWLPLDPTQPLNSIIMQMPWNPLAEAGQVSLGGNPAIPQNDPPVCQDSPQNSVSTNTLTLAVPAEGDSGGPCNTASYDCADKGITGWWPAPGRVTGTVNTPVPVTITKRTHNNGPEGGPFLELWEFEVPANVTASWVGEAGDRVTGNVLTFTEPAEPASTTTLADRILNVECDAPGSYLVVLKNILFPVAPTKDQNLADNAKTSMIQIECGDVSGLVPVDKEVIWAKPVGVSGADIADSTPEHLQLVEGGAATVTVDEMKIYHPETDTNPGNPGPDPESVPGVETFVAETVNQSLIEAFWQSSGTPVFEETVAEDAGIQVDNIENLVVACNAGSAALAQPQPVVIKAIDRPGAGFRETTPGDNVQYRVIKVWCFASSGARTAAADGIDDGTGLYVRWTSFTSNADVRKSGKAGADVGSPSDIEYMEYMVRPECFWLDANGSTDVDADGYISAAESQADPNIPGGGYADIDSDGDCLIDPVFAQPSHKVDSDDSLNSELCAALVYSDSAGNIQVQYDTAADQDCDGLTDGVEAGWTSDPVVGDTDSDGASDFLEMRFYTNPGNVDTDYDGIKDKPEDDYVSAAAGVSEAGTGEVVNGDDNCPNQYNPTQSNNDGQRIASPGSGPPGIPGNFASNPNADAQGDDCDTDDDNDGISDVAELQQTDWSGAACTFGPLGVGLNPYDADTDGDHAVDGAEHYTLTNPCTVGSTAGALTAELTAYFRGGGINVPALGLYGGIWDQTYSASSPWTVRREKDVDGDTAVSKGDAGADGDNDDNSNGSPSEIPDLVEIKGFYLDIGKEDSDGDGCKDWIEIADVNGDRVANILDVQQVAQSALGGEATVEPDNTILDINKDNFLTILDVQVAAKNSDLVKGGANCLPTTSDTLR
jgi:hypothetical protein